MMGLNEVGRVLNYLNVTGWVCITLIQQDGCMGLSVYKLDVKQNCMEMELRIY